jgi:hypothetical protein
VSLGDWTINCSGPLQSLISSRLPSGWWTAAIRPNTKGDCGLVDVHQLLVSMSTRGTGERLENQLGLFLDHSEAPPELLVHGPAVRSKRDRVKQCPHAEADIGVPRATVTVYHAQHQVAAGTHGTRWRAGAHAGEHRLDL